MNETEKGCAITEKQKKKDKHTVVWKKNMP